MAEQLFGFPDLQVGDILTVRYNSPRSSRPQTRNGRVSKIGEVEREYAPTGTPSVELTDVRDHDGPRPNQDPLILWPAWDEVRTDAAGSLGDIIDVVRERSDD